MRIRIKPKENPSEGAKRRISKFAWWPIRVEDSIIWLEWYHSWEIFGHFAKFGKKTQYGWKEIDRGLK